MLKHELLVISATVERPPTNEEQIVEWKKELIKAIGMDILDGPRAVYFTEMEGNRGMTVSSIIKTSHIVLHTWDEVSPAKFELDIYSCAPVDLLAVYAMIEQFGVVSCHYKYIDRDNGLNTIAEGDNLKKFLTFKS